VQEEIGSFGARTSAFAGAPDSRSRRRHPRHRRPGVDEKEIGSHPLGSGPVIGRGSTLSPKVFELLVETAEARGSSTRSAPAAAAPAPTPTLIQISRAGIPTGSVSIPLRYMHSPVELGRPRRPRGDRRADRRLRGAPATWRRPQPLSQRPNRGLSGVDADHDPVATRRLGRIEGRVGETNHLVGVERPGLGDGERRR
jgi:hypothetical protein